MLMLQTEQSPSTPACDRIRSTPITKLAISRKEAAELLSTSLRTFDRWVAAGLIRPSGVGRRKIFTVAELNRFLDETSRTVAI
jgi:excisionase family DNA binding protein